MESIIKDTIKQLRVEAGFTQKELGKKSGISEATIRKYELGLRNPKIGNLKKIATALNTTPEDLLGWSDISRESHESISYSVITDMVYKWDELLGTILEYASGLNDLGQIQALNYIKELSENEIYLKSEKDSE